MIMTAIYVFQCISGCSLHLISDVLDLNSLYIIGFLYLPNTKSLIQLVIDQLQNFVSDRILPCYGKLEDLHGAQRRQGNGYFKAEQDSLS